MNKSDNISTKIISAIEREEIDNTVKSYISEADEFLLNTDNYNKPDFLDDFFDKTKNMLISTVNGCIKSRNNLKKKDDLKKYKEGYFNEIIQNANDVVVNSQIQHPKIEIQCIKYSFNNEYEIVCSYPDKGFSLTDIYGFCSRGNSNKSSEQGQEGMYGIGIKSLFCFATYFCIENNVKIELSSTESLLDTINISYSNIRPNKTKLTLKFQHNEKTENKHAGFNVKKIAGFIDSLIDGENCDDFFYSEEEGQVLFDPRSLIFTELRNNRNVDNSIKTVKFMGNGNIIELNVLDLHCENNANIKISRVKDDMQYLVFHYPDSANDENSLSLAYAINKDWDNLKDKIYATYFVGNYSSLLEKKTGCLVNTKAINSSRSGLERENENDPAILQKIKEKGRETISDLIDILNNDKIEDYWRKITSDVLCHLLDVYKELQIEENKEILPGGIFIDKTEDLRKVFFENKLCLVGNKNYILKIQDSDDIDIEGKIITRNRPANSDDDNCKLLYCIYDKIFIGNDIIFFSSDEFKSLYLGIRKLAETIFNENSCSWLKEVSLPFVDGTKNLIYKRIGGGDFNQIMNFIANCDEQDKVLVKQLVSRFEVNNSFDHMGNYSNENIIDWLFLDKKNNYDDEFEKICSEYEKSYGKLKNLLESHIKSTRYYYSTHWNASRDYWYENFEASGFKNVDIYENKIRQFLNLLSKDIFKFGYNNDRECLFVNSYKNELILRNRERKTTGWDGNFKYFHIDFLNQTIPDFNSFKSFRKSLDDYNEKQTDENFKIKFPKECKIEKVDLTLLQDMFKWLSTYEKEIKVIVQSLHDIMPQETIMIKFAKLFLGDINIRLEKIDAGKNGAKFIGYIANKENDCYTIKLRKKSGEGFKEISKSDKCENDESKNLIVFYSNSDEQTALSDVLSDMNLGEEITKYIDNFINVDNIKQLSSSDYKKYLKRSEMKYEYPFESEDIKSFIKNTKEMTMEEIYTILSSEMSYDDHCPICNSIPTLNIKGDELISANKNCLVVIVPAKYKNTILYVKIICCKSCFEEYKVSLTSAKILDKSDENSNHIHILELKNTICDSSRAYDFTKNIKISPDNWKIISEFNENLVISNN